MVEEKARSFWCKIITEDHLSRASLISNFSRGISILHSYIYVATEENYNLKTKNHSCIYDLQSSFSKHLYLLYEAGFRLTRCTYLDMLRIYKEDYLMNVCTRRICSCMHIISYCDCGTYNNKYILSVKVKRTAIQFTFDLYHRLKPLFSVHPWRMHQLQCRRKF